MQPPLIYNLFPRIAGTMDRWPTHFLRARDMGFNWIFLNPVSEPGLSGSLYSVREHRNVYRDFLSAGASADGRDELRDVLNICTEMGLRSMVDLVINHTAIDSPLIKQHPDWYLRDENGKVRHPSAIDPADARKVSVWGDLAEIDNAESPGRDHLWAFWNDIIHFYQDLGFSGFRCDAAYKVPAVLWRELIEHARERDPQVCFFAETLGCRLEEVLALKPAGFDYLFNSSKYWNYDAPWALEQHGQFGTMAPSVSFPESHDTPRLMTETGHSLAVQRQRYMLAAVFSQGLMMPIGYEFGFSKKLHVVKTRPGDWEETGVDISAFIKAVNSLKVEFGALSREGNLRALDAYDRPTLVLQKTAEEHRALVLINKEWHWPAVFALSNLERSAVDHLIRVCPNGEITQESVPDTVELEPAEIALIA